MNSYCLIGIYLLIIAGIFGIARCFKTYKIDAKPLTQQTLFWLAIVIPIISFIYFGLFAWWGKTPVFSAHGFERFIKISTLPLGLLSLTIPFTAVINNIHRTVQTNEQINQAKVKNDFDISYSHRKNFIDYISNRVVEPFMYTIKLSPLTIKNITKITAVKTFEYITNSSLAEEKKYEHCTYKIESKNIYLLYRNIYSINNNDSPIPNISHEYLQGISSSWLIINDLINYFYATPPTITSPIMVQKYNELVTSIDDLMKKLQLIHSSRKHFYLINVNSEFKIKTFILNNDFLKYLISYLYNVTSDIFLYTESNFSSDKLSSISELINNPSFCLDFLAIHQIVYDHEDKELGQLV